jgi:hypothetical protein
LALPDSYTVKPGSIPGYFDAIQGAEAPERFSIRFLSDLGFSSSNDRLLIGILKDVGFLNADGVPQERYFSYLDRDRSPQVLADGIREAFSDLFAVNKEAHKLELDGVYNKLRTLYKGTKKDTVIKLIARTFVALCEIADFSKKGSISIVKAEVKQKAEDKKPAVDATKEQMSKGVGGTVIGLDSLQYHINIVLPDTRDQAVYDAIFKSLRDHLG